MRGVRKISLPLAIASLAVFLVAFENVVALITGGELFRSGVQSGVQTLAISTALLASVALWMRTQKLSLSDVGITSIRWRSSVAIGLGVGLTIGIAVVLILHSGIGAGGSVSYRPLAQLSTGTVLVRALVWMPLATAIPEEFAFRGVLLALLLRTCSWRVAVVISAIAFALWHVIIVFHTVGQTSLSQHPATYLLGVGLGFAAVFVGGILFANLRMRTGSLAASTLAHWSLNAAVLLGLYVAQ